MNQTPFTVLPENKTATYTKFVIEPLAQGFGHTLGNSLRRVLYSAISGAAITSIQIENASHQFSTIEGVKEDVVQLTLNLKQVRLSYTGTKPTKITLSAKGPGPVTAAKFVAPADVKIANPDLVIANLSDKNSELSIECTVEAGLGYSPAEDRKSNVVGSIVLDAIFSPITRVNYSVESTRVGRLTNYDKLVLEITTDGTITPQAALESAANILVSYFQAVVNPETPVESSTSSTSTSSNSGTGSSVSVEELDLPTRISNALVKAGFESVADLLSTPRAELAKVKNLGGKSVKVIELALRERGFELAA